jgi:response regulator of citrate/malate metabolism
MPNRGVTVTEEEILHAFEETEDPVLGAQEVGEMVGLSRQGAGKRLRSLVEEGKLKRKKPGARTAVYWLPPEDDCR